MHINTYRQNINICWKTWRISLNNVFHQLSLVIKLLKRKFSKRSDKRDTNHQVEHKCSRKGHQESCFIWINKERMWNIYCETYCSIWDTGHGVKVQIHVKHTDWASLLTHWWCKPTQTLSEKIHLKKFTTPHPASPASRASPACAFTSVQQRQTASLTSSSIPGGTSRSTSYTLASYQTRQTCSCAENTASVNVEILTPWSCNNKKSRVKSFICNILTITYISL